MPNGDPDFGEKEYPILEAFFGRIADPIKRFAKRHGLHIERYYHQLPSWRLMFGHPNGGTAYIEVRRVDDSHVRLIMAWWIDDYESATRSSRHQVREPFSIDENIERLLRDALDEVLSWQPGSWSMVTRDYEGEWHRMPKSEFDRTNDTYPTPKM